MGNTSERIQKLEQRVVNLIERGSHDEQKRIELRDTIVEVHGILSQCNSADYETAYTLLKNSRSLLKLHYREDIYLPFIPSP